MDNSAVFADIDNTIVKGTTLKMLGQYFLFRRRINIFFFIRVLFWYFQYKRNKLHEFSSLLQYVFTMTQEWDLATTNRLISACFKEKIKPRIYIDVEKKLREHHEKGCRVYFVSSTILPIAELLIEHLGFGIPVVTVPKTNEHAYTGEIVGEVCYGQQKIVRLKQIIQQERINVARSYAYSDHISDLPLLELAGKSVVVNPGKKLACIAAKRGWEIIRTKAVKGIC